MRELSEWVRSGRIVDLILALVLLEALLLWAWRARLPARPQGLDLIGVLAPGVCLLMALRGALTGAVWTVIAGWLAAALLPHLFDLARRFGR